MKSVATFTWQEFLDVSEGTAVSHHRHFEPASVDTDTRTMAPGSFFLPLKGENFDGNEYIEKAFEQGAEGAFVAESYLASHPDLKRFPNLIAVPDPLLTYLALGRCHRRRCNVRVIAITGSSGKTTTKEMTYQLFQAVLGDRVQRSEKNFNNEVGVALTLLNIQPETEVMVLEMGMRGLGQIGLLSRHAEPDIGIVTNIGPAHVGLLGSLEAIARAKCEIFEGMDPSEGVGIINEDDALLVQYASQAWDGRMETFSLNQIEDIHTHSEEGVSFSLDDVVFEVGLPGSHNVLNALAGIIACKELGMPLKRIAHALAHFEAGGARWQKRQLEGTNNLWVINDAYNANPASVKVALGAFMDLKTPGLKKVAVLGGMAELGEFSEQYHREIGEWLNSTGNLDGLILVGSDVGFLAEAILPNTIPTYVIQANAEAVDLIRQHWPENTMFFLKASRAFHLEEIIEQLTPQTPAPNPHAVS